MQLGRVGVVLYGLDKGIDGFVLLLVEQKVQAFEVRLGSLAVVGTHLAQIPAGSQPAQHKGRRQAQQNPSQIKFHARRPAQ